MEWNDKIGRKEIFIGMWDEQASLCAGQLLGIWMLFGGRVYERLDVHDVCSMIDDFSSFS